MSYDQKKQEHDEMMTRIRAEINGNDPREAVIADLRAQLAAATERAEKAEAVLANIPMASLLRFVAAILMRGQPLEYDADAVEKWVKQPLARV